MEIAVGVEPALGRRGLRGGEWSDRPYKRAVRLMCRQGGAIDDSGLLLLLKHLDGGRVIATSSGRAGGVGLMRSVGQMMMKMMMMVRLVRLPRDLTVHGDHVHGGHGKNRVE